MFKTIEEATDCEIQSVIRFLNTRNVLPSEIHHQICQVYGDNAMSDGMHEEAQSGLPSLVNDDLVCKVNEKTGVSQFLICPCIFLRFQGLYSMTLSVVI